MSVFFFLFTLVVILGEVAMGVRAAIRVLCYIQRSKKTRLDAVETLESQSYPILLVMIPCLDEQEIICETLDYFHEVFPSSRCSIVVVTTAKEQRPEGGFLTREVVDRYTRSGRNSVLIYDYPGEHGYMADQLNYALHALKCDGTEWDYVSVYNADSRPDRDTYWRLLPLMLSGCQVIQQYSAMTANLNMLTPLMKAFALYQSNYELKSGLLGCAVPSVFCIPHVAGHGLCVKKSLLNKLGNFCTDHWCEDVFMSFSLYNRGVAVTPLSALEEADAPTSFRYQLVQYSVWFKTAFDVVGVAKTESKAYPVGMRGIWYLAQRLSRSLMWLVSPSLILLSITAPVVKGWWDIALVSCGAFLFMCYAEFGSTAVLLSNLGVRKANRDIVLALLLCPIARLLSCLGPFRSFFEREKRRTPR